PNGRGPAFLRQELMVKRYPLFLSPIRGQRTEDRYQRSEESGNIQIGLTNNARFAFCSWDRLICARAWRVCSMRFANLKMSRSSLNLLVRCKSRFHRIWKITRAFAGSM